MSPAPLHSVERHAHRCSEHLERRRLCYLAAISLVYFVGVVARASGKLFWFDELVTLYVSRLPTMAEVWAALSTAADANPPLFHVITRAAHALIGEGPIGTRLPAMMGFWIMGLCLFRFVSRRFGPLYGLLAMLVPFFTEAHWYAYEARPYGLVLGLSGVALVCWQSAADDERRPLSLVGLALSLAALVSSHYFAVFVFVPIALGEIARTLGRRRVDWPIWLCLGAAITPLAFHQPLLRAGSVYAMETFAKAQWKEMFWFYDFLLRPAIAPAMAAVTAVALFHMLPRAGRDGVEREDRGTLRFHETVAALGLVALPLFGVAAGKLVTGVFQARYVLPAVLGVSLMLAVAAAAVNRSRPGVGAALAVTLFAVMAAQTVWASRSFVAPPSNVLREHPLLAVNGGGDLPIVVGNADAFLTLTHYAPPALGVRLVYLTDSVEAVRYSGTHHGDQGLLALARWAPGMRLDEYRRFVAGHSEFLLYWAGTEREWQLTKLVSDGARLEIQAKRGRQMLFRVTTSK